MINLYIIYPLIGSFFSYCIAFRAFHSEKDSTNFTTTNVLFLKKHLIKKKSILNLAYFWAKKCDENNPRYDLFSYSVLFTTMTLVICISLFVINIFLDLLALKIIVVSLSVLCVVFSYVFADFSTDEAYKIDLLYQNLSKEEIEKIKQSIEDEWPGFWNEPIKSRKLK